MTEVFDFDKGLSPTGVYITDPAVYSAYIEFSETLPVDVVEEKYEWYDGFLVSKGGYGPYAFQSRPEGDKHIKFIGDKAVELGQDFMIWCEERKNRPTPRVSS